jgi:hypothetical protein
MIQPVRVGAADWIAAPIGIGLIGVGPFTTNKITRQS